MYDLYDKVTNTVIYYGSERWFSFHSNDLFFHGIITYDEWVKRVEATDRYYIY